MRLLTNFLLKFEENAILLHPLHRVFIVDTLEFFACCYFFVFFVCF